MNHCLTEGYSGTPLTKKLGIKANSNLRLLNQPTDFEITLGELPKGVQIVNANFHIAVAFCTTNNQIESTFISLMNAMEDSSRIWIAWPKKASGVVSECSDQIVREIGLSFGLVDNKICAIDATWSGLQFVVRTENRKSNG